MHDVSSFYDPKSKKFTKDPFEGVKGTVKITMQKYKSEISMSTNIRNIRVVPEAIEIKNSCGTFLMVLTPASFNLMFDRIIFRAQQ